MPELDRFMKPRKIYVDDTITYIKPDLTTNVIDILNKFHQNIKFTYEVEHNGKISFLDVLLMRCNGKLETTAFRKETNNDIYLHWRFFAPMTWKKSTLRTLIRQTYTVCSNDNLLQEELCHIEKSFTEFNGYPKWLLKQTLDSFENNNKNHNNNINNKNHNNTNLNRLSDKIVHTLKLPYNGDHSINLIKSIITSTKKSLPEKHDVRIILTGTKLSSQFNIKDDTNEQRKHDLVYFSRCPSTNCTDSYRGETARCPSERVMDHAGRDTKLHIVRHCLNSNHEAVNTGNFKILNMEYNNNT